MQKDMEKAIAFLRSGNVVKAEDALKKILRRSPLNMHAIKFLVQISYNRGDLDAAASYLRKAIHLSPKNPDNYNNLGVILKGMGRIDEAIECFRNAIKYNENFINAHYNLGNALKTRGNFDDAVASYQTALRLDPKDSEAWNNLGNVLKEMVKLDEALSCYERSLDINPCFTIALNNMGTVFQQKGLFEKASQCYQKAIKDVPKYPEGHHNLGIISQITGHLDEAIRYYQKAIELKPDFADAYCDLGSVFREKGQFDDAINYFKKAIHLQKDFSWAYANLGIALDNKGQFQEAKNCFLEYFSSVPRLSNQYSHFNELLEKQEDAHNVVNSAGETHKMSLLISVCAYNRKKITQLSLAQTKRYKSALCHLQVYDDHSNEYDSDFLAEYADQVIKLPDKMGINDLRWCQFRIFLESGFDLLYMTDNDVIHDPEFLLVLMKLYDMGERKLPVTLYNNIYTLRPHMIVSYKNGLILKTTVPGNSMLLDKAMVKKILDVSGKAGHDFDYLPWDNRAVVFLGLPWLSTETSYLEHYGAQGINNDNYDRDRAIFPTEYLKDRRESILNYLRTDSDCEISW